MADANTDNTDTELTKNDLVSIIYAEIDKKGIAGHHIDSMNTFYDKALPQIITQLFKIEVEPTKNLRTSTEEDREIKAISCSVIFTDVKLNGPTTTNNSNNISRILLTPNLARLKNLTYSATLYVNARIEATAYLHSGEERKITEEIKDWRIASIPVMVGSKLCTTYNQTKETLKNLEEDPQDCGGYFIINGNEWVIEMVENMPINNFQVFKNKHQTEIARGTILSKPGDYYDNLYMVIFRYLQNGAITIDLTVNVDEHLVIPFYILFRLFGITNDREIIDHIVYGVDNDDVITSSMKNILERAFTVEESKVWNNVRNSTNPTEILEEISKMMNKQMNQNIFNKEPNILKWYNTRSLEKFDKYLLPHLGNNSESRIKKLRYIGHLINKLLLVVLDVVESSDRDSYENKRIATAGINLAKTLKTNFNFAVVQACRRHLITDFQSTEFSKIPFADSVRASVKPTDLERVMNQQITSVSSVSSINNTIQVQNRTVSQPVYRKNDLNVKSQLNTITVNNTNVSSAKQTDRADEMRRVQPSYLGNICISQSADTGEKVGLIKQMACSASICESADSNSLKMKIYMDEEFIPLDDVLPSEITSRKLCKIFINGDWIGFCENSHTFVFRWRMKRRADEIHAQTTILWKELTREIYFWVDVGRITRPLICVYSNISEYIENRKQIHREKDGKNKSGKKTTPIQYKQWIKLTRAHIDDLLAKKITIDDLRAKQIIEYISAEEQQNTYIAENYDIFKKHSDDITYQYTHCEIEQAIFGLLALASPCGSHTPGTRTTYSTNQKKQTCGWFALNYPYRMDKHTFLQYYCQLPTIKCFSDTISYPNNENLISAYMMYSGYNQEDSCIINKAAVSRGLFNGCHYYYEKTEVQRGEQITPIDRIRTTDIKKNAIYQFLDERGLIRENTMVKKNYVLISKVEQLQKPLTINNINYHFKDRSIIYREEEPAYVEKVLLTYNDEGTQICKVKLRANRPIQVGDKISTRMGNKGIVCEVMRAEDMPYDENGLAPDIITTPNSIPTRMCIGQIIEGCMAQLAVRKGTIYDATTFFRTDYKDILEKLRAEGVTFQGYRRLFNGKTGVWMDTLIFMVPTSYNRLAKFVKDGYHAINTGPTNAITRQPIDGLRIGEMEKDVLMAHGSVMTLDVKFNDDSDGIMLPICRICNRVAIINESKSIYKCMTCKQTADIAMVPSTWVANVLIHEVNAMNISMKFALEPYKYTKRELKNIEK